MGLSPPLYLLLCFGIVTVSWVAAQDEWDVVMARVHQAAMNGASHEGLDHLLSFLQPDGSFSDINYGAGTSTPFRNHGRRLSALGYHYHNGADVAQNLTTSFYFITYDAPLNQDSNWWGQVIGTPTYMWEGAVLARDVLPATLLTDFLNKYWVNTPDGPVWNPELHNDQMAGGNFAPRAMMAEVEGLLRGTAEDIHAQVAEGMEREFVAREAWNDAGLRQDGCLHQHTMHGNYGTENGYLDHSLALVYNGNYGKELIRFASKLFTWFTGTSLDYSPDAVEGLFQAYLQCNRWLFRGHTMEPSVCGRFIDGGNFVTITGTKGSVWETGQNLLVLGLHHDDVTATLHRYENTVPEAEYALEGHRHFFNSDLTAHQRINYMATIRVLSNRTCRPETYASSSNKNGFFQGDGFLTVLVDGKEYGEPYREVLQVYDWARVPGVTNLYTTDIPHYQIGAWWAERFFNNATFVGGVTDGWVGLTFMESRRPHVQLTALKSWFFFDDAIVVLGSDIRLEPDGATGESVVTTLQQSSYIGQHVVGQADGQEVTLGMGVTSESGPAWLHHRGVGYVFLAGGEQLVVAAEARTLADDAVDVFTAWIDHGSRPDEAVLAYAVLPDADLNRTRSYALNPEVVVLSQTSDVHAVCHAPSQTVGAALVSGGTVTVPSCGGAGLLEIRVDVPCLLLATVEDSLLLVSLADPQQVYDTVQLSVSYAAFQMNRTVTLPGVPKKGSSTTEVFIV